MIKITVNPQHEPKSFAFDQDLIVIGDGSPETVDICFPAEGLHQNHLRVVLKEDGYWVINQANDPFVTYNGQPFGKKKLQTGDLIQIRDHVLKIEELTTTAPAFPVALPTQPSADLASDPYNAYPDVDNLANDENPEAWFPSDLSAMQHNEGEEGKLSDHANAQRHVPPPVSPISSKQWRRQAFKITVVSVLAICAIVTLTFFEFYFRAHNKSDREEMWAAESLSDYAMALTYAKVYHIAPQKQNWVDPFFIKNNLADLLSATSIVCGNIDAQGQFYNCPYLLRFYTNRDFSRFLLLAQPEPTLSQWLIPKVTLLIDSTSMEIRTTQDLRTFNRLLSNANPLDGSNGDEIQEAIQKTPVMPLNFLAKSIGKKEFAPPKALSYLKPGAENRIYNAPRYHQFSSTFLKKVISLSDQPLTNHDLSILQSELSFLSKFPDLVFFSPGGMQEAIQGSRALKKLASSSHSFFTAYLLLSDKGDIINSHIVLDSEQQTPEKEEVLDDKVAIAEAALSPQYSLMREEEILGEHLRKQSEKAQKTLHPLILNLHILLSDTVDKDSLHLPATFFDLLTLYENKKASIRSEIEQTLESFRNAYPNVDPFLVDKMLREYGLLDIYHTLPSSKKQEQTKASLVSLLSQNRIMPSFSFLANRKYPAASNSWAAYIHLQEIGQAEPFQPPYRYYSKLNP
jgi:hypothetical protein